MKNPQLILKNLCVYHQTDLLVNNVDLSIQKGSVLALVGESGSGKSLTAQAIMKILAPPFKSTSLCLKIDSLDIQTYSSTQMQSIRGKWVAMALQNAFEALNPCLTIGQQMLETLQLHYPQNSQNAHKSILEIMDQMKIPPTYFNAYPYQLSGGMHQRINLSLAVLGQPKLLIVDEPTTALDLYTTHQILNVLKTFLKHFDLSILFITHDFSFLNHFANTISVMYAGTIVEQGPALSVLENPKMPYTKALLECIPRLGAKKLASIPTGLAVQDQGCSFRNRCKFANSECQKPIPWKEVAPEHWIRCVL